jgi:hypothetical protein
LTADCLPILLCDQRRTGGRCTPCRVAWVGSWGDRECSDTLSLPPRAVDGLSWTGDWSRCI